MEAIARLSDKLARRGPDSAGTRNDVAMGYVFFSEGDSEVILKACHAWGQDCVWRFYGMFAFAIWDMRDRRDGGAARLFLGRDRFGIKPL